MASDPCSLILRCGRPQFHPVSGKKRFLFETEGRFVTSYSHRTELIVRTEIIVTSFSHSHVLVILSPFPNYSSLILLTSSHTPFKD